MSLKLINKKLIILERNIRRAEKLLDMKVYPWLVKRNIRNQGANRETNLTDRMIKFCEEYPKDMNATRSAIRAGYAEKGAAVQGCYLLKLTKIQLRIKEMNSARMKRLDITTDNVIKEIALIAFSNINNIATWNKSSVTLRDSGRLTNNDTACIQSIEEKIGQYGNALKVKLYDKPQALVLLCRYLNILDGEANLVNPDDTAEKFKAAYTGLFGSVPLAPPEPKNLDDIKPKNKKIYTTIGATDPPGQGDNTDYVME